ncbi:MAG: hypothetical protein EAX95_03640 [Candidatus Thorarchaeota archaeon]|nr:hypothetical protein [Candidatus Thorarchaeota archaeon]
MKTYVLLYDEFVQFEIVLALLLLRDKSEIHTFSIDDKVVPAFEKLHVMADMMLDDVNPSEIDLLLIPGGEPGKYRSRQDVNDLIREISNSNKEIAAICGGPEFLSNAGIIRGRRITHGHSDEYARVVFKDSVLVDKDVVVDGKIITARGQAFAEFAVEIGRQVGLFENEEEAIATLNLFKNR